MTDAGQESLSTEGGKVVSAKGSWTIPLGMYNDVEEQASEMESEKQVSNCSKRESKERVDVKETSSDLLQHSDERGSPVAKDRVNEQEAVEENSRKHKTKKSNNYDSKCLRSDDDDGHRHKDRHQSKSAEDKHHHHKVREETVRHKRRSRESPSRVQSPQHLQERNDDMFSGKNESTASNGRLLESVSQSGFERKTEDKEQEQEHSRKNVLKSDCRERSPYRDNERQNARGEETNHDQTHRKRRRSNSRERSKDITHEDRGLRSDRRRQKHRSRSRSRGRGDRYKRRERSRSQSRDNGHNRSKSLSRNSDAEPKQKTVDKKLRSRSREQEAMPVPAWTNSDVDAQKQSGEEDGWRKRRSKSRSPSKHSYENFGSKDREHRRSHSRDHSKNWRSNERQADSDYPKRHRSRSRSAERVRNSSNWEDRRRYRDDYSRDALPNSGVWSSRPDRVTNNKYYHGPADRQNSWRGEREDNTMLLDQSRENVMPRDRLGNQDHSGSKDRSWGRDRNREWDNNYRNRRVNQEDQDTVNDNGQQLEDMVTKSLAKLRRDSDREHRGDYEAVKDGTRGEDNKIRDKGQRWGEADRSAIPVLLSKKSAYKDNDRYDHHETEDFNYDQACKDDLIHESNSRSLQPRDQQQPPAQSQLRFPAPAKERHVPVGQPRFHGDFHAPPPHVRLEFPPRGKALMQSPAPSGQFGIGARLMPGVVQLVTPIHLRPPHMAVDWRMMGPDPSGRGVFPISRPPPHVGPRGQLIQVGGFIRSQVPVEFLTRHPLPPGHPPRPPFQTGPLPSHSLPPVHPGTPSQPLSIRPHLQSDPRQLPPPPPIAMLHSSHQLRLPNQEPPRRLVEIRHLGPPPGLLQPPCLIPPHPPPNLTFPPPPLPIKLVSHDHRGHQSLGYQASNQAVETSDANSPSTPPPPPPPAVSSALQDPRLYSIKLVSNKKPVAVANSTSDESLDSETSSLAGHNESIAAPKPSIKQTWHQQQSNSPERPNSALSFGSDYTPQELTDDAYTEALFEEPYSFDERDAMTVRSEKSELNPRPSISALESTERTNIVKIVELAGICSQPAVEDETAQIPEIVNPMASPMVTERLGSDKSSSDNGSPVALATAAVTARSLRMIEVADLKKVLETVRTTTLSNDEEAKSQDKTSKRMDQIAEEVKLALKPHFAKNLINKNEYKDIMRKTVPKIFSSKSTLDRSRIQGFVQEYVNKILRSRKPDKAKKSVSQGHGLPKHGSKALSKAV